MMNMQAFFEKAGVAENGAAANDPQAKKIGQVWSKFVHQLLENPKLWIDAVQEGQRKQLEIVARLKDEQPVVQPPKGDRRFGAEKWQTNPLFSMLMQSYLINSDIMRALVDQVDMDETDKKILHFAVNQYVNAVSPTNFPATNPEVMDEAMKTGGESLAKGMQNFLQDWKSGSMVKNTDMSSFTVGENVAATPGTVIYENPFFQLIEYAPQTKQVYSCPLLIVPPCINKYYILDLTQPKSMINYLVSQGQRVFLVSWVNAALPVGHFSWDDYLRNGVMTAIEAVQVVTKQDKIHMMGYCVGGTLLVSALAALAAGGEQPAQTVTQLAAMLDFSDAGEIGLFIDEESVQHREAEFADGGLVDGTELARGFAMLRPNDLIWPYVIDNYYKGKEPAPFDLLYWNSDSTNLPGKMFAEYLRMTYLENQITNGTAVMCGEKIVPSRIKAPVYSVSCQKDHIVPWQTAYKSAKLFGGRQRFVLAASGHTAGIINPPAAKKGWHWVADTAAADAEHWLEKAQKCEGSWWEDWVAFLSAHGGKQVAAPQRPGNIRYAPIEAAPGSYVRIPRPPVNGKAMNGADDAAPAEGLAPSAPPEPSAQDTAPAAPPPARAAKRKPRKAGKPAQAAKVAKTAKADKTAKAGKQS